jgi:hypothetical protein
MPEAPLILLGWLLISPLDEFCKDDDRYLRGADMADDLMLPEQFAQPLKNERIPERFHPHIYELMLAVSSQSHWTAGKDYAQVSRTELLEALIREPYSARLLRIHWDGDVEWYHGESMQEFIWWLNTLAVLDQVEAGQSLPQTDGFFSMITEWIEAEERAEYKVRNLLHP